MTTPESEQRPESAQQILNKIRAELAQEWVGTPKYLAFADAYAIRKTFFLYGQARYELEEFRKKVQQFPELSSEIYTLEDKLAYARERFVSAESRSHEHEDKVPGYVGFNVQMFQLTDNYIDSYIEERGSNIHPGVARNNALRELGRVRYEVLQRE